MIKQLIVKLPYAYKMRINQLRFNRYLKNKRVKFATHQENEALKYTMKRHQSLLRKKLGSSDPELQENKITNLAIALHTPMQISERHHHSFDPFPDENRVMPFGSGASVFYNYVDLRITNPTNQRFQMKVWLTKQHLKGTIQFEQEWPIAFHIEERNHQFHQKNGKKYRENELWRIEIDKRTGLTLKEEMIIHNYAEVKYEIQPKPHVQQGYTISQ